MKMELEKAVLQTCLPAHIHVLCGGEIPSLLLKATDRLSHLLAIPGQILRKVPLEPWAASRQVTPQNSSALTKPINAYLHSLVVSPGFQAVVPRLPPTVGSTWTNMAHINESEGIEHCPESVTTWQHGFNDVEKAVEAPQLVDSRLFGSTSQCSLFMFASHCTTFKPVHATSIQWKREGVPIGMDHPGMCALHKNDARQATFLHTFRISDHSLNSTANSKARSK